MFEKTHKKIFKLSLSSLNLMRECPRCFWLEKHKVWKRPTGIFPSLPNGMDRILKEHFNRFRDKGQMPPELCEHDSCAEMKLFGDKEKLKTWQNNREGIFCKDKEGNILHGAIDNLLVKKNKLIVLDYKTRGYAPKDGTADHYQLQLDIYNFLLRKNDYQTEDYAFLLFYVPSKVLETGEVIFDTSLVKIKVNIENAEKTWKKALELLNSQCPQKRCKWCERF